MFTSPAMHHRPLATPKPPAQHPKDPCLHLGSLLDPLGTSWLHPRPLPCTPVAPAQLPDDMSQALSPPRSSYTPASSLRPSPGSSHPCRVPPHPRLLPHRLSRPRPSAQSLGSSTLSIPDGSRQGSISKPPRPALLYPPPTPCQDPARAPLAQPHHSKLFCLGEACVQLPVVHGQPPLGSPSESPGRMGEGSWSCPLSRAA